MPVLFHELTTTDLSPVPVATETPMMLRVWAAENTCWISVRLNTLGLNADGENALGLNADGENALGLNADGVYTFMLNADGENALGLNADGENALGLNADGENALGLNADGENALGLKAEGAYSAVSFNRLAVLAVAGVNWLRNAR